MSGIQKALVASLTFALLALTGCGSSDQEELQQWMTAQLNAARPNVTPLASPTKFTP